MAFCRLRCRTASGWVVTEYTDHRLEIANIPLDEDVAVRGFNGSERTGYGSVRADLSTTTA